MAPSDQALSAITASLPDDLAELLRELESNRLLRLMVLQRAIQQRAHAVGVVIATRMARLHLAVPVIPPDIG